MPQKKVPEGTPPTKLDELENLVHQGVGGVEGPGGSLFSNSHELIASIGSCCQKIQNDFSARLHPGWLLSLQGFGRKHGQRCLGGYLDALLEQFWGCNRSCFG